MDDLCLTKAEFEFLLRALRDEKRITYKDADADDYLYRPEAHVWLNYLTDLEKFGFHLHGLIEIKVNYSDILISGSAVDNFCQRNPFTKQMESRKTLRKKLNEIKATRHRREEG